MIKIQELKLIEKASTTKEVLNYVMESTENTLPQNTFHYLKYKDDVSDIIKIVENSSELSSQNFEILKARLSDEVDEKRGNRIRD